MPTKSDTVHLQANSVNIAHEPCHSVHNLSVTNCDEWTVWLLRHGYEQVMMSYTGY